MNPIDLFLLHGVMPYWSDVRFFRMTTITFDTHKFVRKLQEAGFDERQAEGLTEAMRAAIDDSELVTRSDMREFELSQTLTTT